MKINHGAYSSKTQKAKTIVLQTIVIRIAKSRREYKLQSKSDIYTKGRIGSEKKS
jgi:hypothetical protein